MVSRSVHEICRLERDFRQLGSKLVLRHASQFVVGIINKIISIVPKNYSGIRTRQVMGLMEKLPQISAISRISVSGAQIVTTFLTLSNLVDTKDSA